MWLFNNKPTWNIIQKDHLNQSFFHHISKEVYNLKTFKGNNFPLFCLTLNIIQSPSQVLHINPFSSIRCE